MPIDKIIPSVLNKSDDERLLKKNEMSDAANITVSTSSDGTGFVVKNSKGTTSVRAFDASNKITGEYKTLGSCVDEEDQKVYFAAYDVVGNDHAILVLDMNLGTPTYKKVFVSQYLFDSEPEYVDMDVLRADVNQSGIIQPILYFTDGVNNPKKMNVTRAMDSSDAGGYTAEADIREFLDVAKTKPVHQFFVESATNTDFKGNFLYGKSYSFCFQWVYKDGEHSAFSNLSEICIPTNILSSREDGVKKVSGNHFYMGIPVGNQEVTQINIAFRNNQTNTYFLAERVTKGEDIVKNGITRWDDSEEKFYFFGEGDYEIIPNIEAMKTFDNVPLTAKTQCLADGRLMYGNYTEGREVPELQADLTVTYNNPYDVDRNVPVFSGVTSGSGVYRKDKIKIDLSNFQSTFFDGDELYMDFNVEYDQFFTYAGNGTSIITLNDTDNSTVWEAGNGISYPLIFDDFSFRVVANAIVPPSNTDNLSSYATRVKDALDGKIIYVDYVNAENSDTSFDRTSGSAGTDPLNAAITSATIQLELEASAGTDSVEIDVKLRAITNWNSDSSFAESQNSVVTSSTSSGDVGENTAPYIRDLDTTWNGGDFFGYRTFKGGSNHNIGMILYDKKGRSSFVRELGSVYVPTLGERDANQRGTARINVEFPQISATDQRLPDWVDKFQFVYGGGDLSRFKQYTVSGGFASFYRYWDAETESFSDSDDNIYVSLRGWQGSKGSYTNSSGAKNIYQYRKGDVLRVISYDKIDNGAEVRVFPEKLEFKVVGKKRLLADVEDATIDALRAEHEISGRQFYIPEGGDPTDISNATRGSERGSGAPREGTYETEVIDGQEYIVMDGPRVPITGQGSSINSFPSTGDEMMAREYGMSVEEYVSYREALEEVKNTPFDQRNPIFPGDWNVAKGDFLILQPNNSEGWNPDDATHVKAATGQGQFEPAAADSSGHDSADENAHWHPILNWARNVVVEIYTPKKSTNQKVYRELTKVISRGDTGFEANGDLTSTETIQLRAGDVWLKRTPLSFLSKNTNGYSIDHYFNYWGDFTLTDRWIESRHASYFFESDSMRFGKPHFVNKYAANNSRAHSITYSDRYNSDSPILTLSNFNLSKANYTDLSSSYGSIDRVFSTEGFITCIQGNKAGRIPVGKTALKLATNTDVLTTSNVVLGRPTYYAGDYGTRGISNASVVHDGNVFFVDYVSRKVVQIAGNGMNVISSAGMDSFFQENLGDWSRLTTSENIFIGYDPDYNEVIVVAPRDTAESFDGICVGYNTNLKRWTSRYDMFDEDGNQPTLFENIGNKLISCTYSPQLNANGFEDTYLHIHEDSANRGHFYGHKKTSVIEVSSNANPSMVKVFESVAIEGNSDNFRALINTSDQNTSILSWEERERGYYSLMPRDESSNSTSHKLSLPFAVKDESNTGSTFIVFDGKLSRVPIPFGAKLYNETKDQVVQDNTSTDVTVTGFAPNNSSVINISGALTSAELDVGDVLSVLLDQKVYGDAIRDYFCKIRVTNNNDNGTEWELFTINTHYDRSKLGAEKG